jgi:hypothetical protein
VTLTAVPAAWAARAALAIEGRPETGGVVRAQCGRALRAAAVVDTIGVVVEHPDDGPADRWRLPFIVISPSVKGGGPIVATNTLVASASLARRSSTSKGTLRPGDIALTPRRGYGDVRSSRCQSSPWRHGRDRACRGKMAVKVWRPLSESKREVMVRLFPERGMRRGGGCVPGRLATPARRRDRDARLRLS